MWNFLRAYFPLICQLVGGLGITLSSLAFSVWYDEGEKDYRTTINSLSSNQENFIITAPFWDVISHNKYSFSKPVPYVALSLVFALLGGIGGLKNQYKINKYDKLELNHRTEKSDHGETKKNYNEAIGHIIQSIFVSRHEIYNNTCRLTIYRHTNDGHFQKIFRHTVISRFEGGRLRIPDSEGIVGAAWLNDGVAHITLQHRFDTQSYRSQLEKELLVHGAKLPSCNTRMPSKDYFAMAVRGVDKRKMAVIVLESTESGRFDKTFRDMLRNLVVKENGDLAKYILHKGKLDEILNPMGDLENG